MHFSTAINHWITQRRSEGYSPYTLQAYQLQLGLLLRHTGDVDIETITLETLREYIAGPASERRKLSTIAHRIRVIRSFFSWLVNEGHLGKSPAARLREPKLGARIPKALPFEDLELLRDACRTAREHALIEALFATGCRALELSTIQRPDVDWERRSIIVLGKGSKEREVYFGARAGMWLRRYLSERMDDCPYLFATERRPIRRLMPHQLWYLVKGIGARAGLRERVWPHRLRHTPTRR